MDSLGHFWEISEGKGHQRGWRCDRLAVLDASERQDARRLPRVAEHARFCWRHHPHHGGPSRAVHLQGTMWIRVVLLASCPSHHRACHKTGDISLLARDVMLNLEDWRCLPWKNSVTTAPLRCGWAQLSLPQPGADWPRRHDRPEMREHRLQWLEQGSVTSPGHGRARGCQGRDDHCGDPLGDYGQRSGPQADEGTGEERHT